jgi:hypothetical protein
MPKRTSTIAKKFKPNQGALDAWHAGDLWALHAACGLAPWELSPLPEDRFGAYGLPTNPDRESDLCIDLSWDEVKQIQDQLYALAGEPGEGE